MPDFKLPLSADRSRTDRRRDPVGFIRPVRFVERRRAGSLAAFYTGFVITVSVGSDLVSLGADVHEVAPLRLGTVLAIAQFSQGSEDQG